MNVGEAGGIQLASSRTFKTPVSTIRGEEIKQSKAFRSRTSSTKKHSFCIPSVSAGMEHYRLFVLRGDAGDESDRGVDCRSSLPPGWFQSSLAGGLKNLFRLLLHVVRGVEGIRWDPVVNQSSVRIAPSAEPCYQTMINMALREHIKRPRGIPGTDPPARHPPGATPSSLTTPRHRESYMVVSAVHSPSKTPNCS